MVHTDNTEDITMIWIDVNDHLPPTGVDSVYGSAWVLISYLFDGKQYEAQGKFVKTNRNPYWKDVHGDKIEVTHWMNMPPSPTLK